MSWSASAEASNMLELRRALKQDFADKHVGAVEEEGLGLRTVTDEGVSEQFRTALKAAEQMADRLGGKVGAELSGDEDSITVTVSHA